MIKKPFFGYATANFNYSLLGKATVTPVSLPIPKQAVLLVPDPNDVGPTGFDYHVGSTVKTGQLLKARDNDASGIYCTVTGTIVETAVFLGHYGEKFLSLTIECDQNDQWDDGFSQAVEADKKGAMDTFLRAAPGMPDFKALVNEESSIDTLVVLGADPDLLLETNLTVITEELDEVAKGIEILKDTFGFETVLVVAPGDNLQNVDSHFPARAISVPLQYPEAQPLAIMRKVLNRHPSQDESISDLGVVFFKAEAAVSVARAFNSGKLPLEKLITLIDKQGRKKLVKARMGTPIGDILQRFNIETGNGDRIIAGGPMTGTSIFSLAQPVTATTDAIMVQDNTQIVFSSDYPCINCGDCVRNCPENIQVNMLVRFLEAGQYQEAANMYELYACVECGLCSFVCPSRIPILQYIKLAKFELERTLPAEEDNA